MITATLSRPIWRGLAAAGILATAMSMGALSAAAGECPAGRIVADGNGQKAGGTKPKGVTDNVLTRINLANEPVMLRDHALRLRRLVVKPGGIVPWHSHTDRPAIIYIISGKITEYRSTCAEPIVHRAGEFDGGGERHLPLVEEHRQGDRGAAVGRSVPRQGRPARDVSVSPDGWSVWLPPRAHALPLLEGDHTPALFFRRSRIQSIGEHEVQQRIDQAEPATRPAAELAGKTAVVTGSTSGIGLGIAQALAEAGMHVMLNGFGDKAEIEKTQQEIEERFGVKTAYSAADMTRPADIVGMVEDAREMLGKVDVLVNNAGIQHVEAIETFPVAKWDAIIAIDLSSAFHATRAVVPEMKARKWGRIINIASAHGLVASPFKSAYVAAKHGVLGFTKTVALETAEHGITVNAICPGYVLTPLVQKQIPETAKARGLTEEQVIRDVLLHAQPTHQFVTTEQIGALALFLCSNAAGSITGTALPIEGGWTAQ